MTTAEQAKRAQAARRTSLRKRASNRTAAQSASNQLNRARTGANSGLQKPSRPDSGLGTRRPAGGGLAKPTRKGVLRRYE